MNSFHTSTGSLVDTSCFSELTVKSNLRARNEALKPIFCGKPYNKNKKTLIFNLNKTLIYVQRLHLKTKTKANLLSTKDSQDQSVLNNIYIKRPDLIQFLAKMADLYNIAVVSKASNNGTQDILLNTGIDKFIFKAILYRDLDNSTDLFEEQRLDPSKTIYISGSNTHLRVYPENLLVISKFKGSTDDQELSKIESILSHVHHLKDVRPIQNYANFFLESCSYLETATLEDGIDEEGTPLQSRCLIFRNPASNLKNQKCFQSEPYRGYSKERKDAPGPPAKQQTCDLDSDSDESHSIEVRKIKISALITKM